MSHVYCCDAQQIFVDRGGIHVSDLDEALDHAARLVSSLISMPSTEDWRSWELRVSDELGGEIFVLPFDAMLGKPH